MGLRMLTHHQTRGRKFRASKSKLHRSYPSYRASDNEMKVRIMACHLSGNDFFTDHAQCAAIKSPNLLPRFGQFHRKF